MKWMHIADLHIGKSHEATELYEDQKRVLDEILSIAEREKPDGVFIAGDVYDRSVPSEAAVKLLDSFLTKLTERAKVYMISGNHDSGGRLAFASDLLASRGLYVSGTYSGKIEPITQGDTDIYLLPFLHPVEVRRVLGSDGISSMDDAVRAAIATCVPGKAKRRILLAHLFVTANGVQPESCDSELANVGGLDSADVSAFDGFDYVALGHIHGPQCVGRETVRYSGTPMMYSFSEEKHVKSVTVIDLESENPVRTVPLTAGRRMRRVRGLLCELLTPGFDMGDKDDIVLAELTDKEPQVSAQARLGTIYSTVCIKYVNLHGEKQTEFTAGIGAVEKDDFTLFEEFFRARNDGSEMDDEQKAVVRELLSQAVKEDE